MTKKPLYVLLFFLVLPFACHTNREASSIQTWKNEILETERDFAELAKAEGIEKAFTTYAAEDAVIMRNDALIIGKSKISEKYKGQTAKGLAWIPEFVSVSASGDLGYTYGHYTFSSLDSLGRQSEQKGVFHTVWKRQADDSWRFVWD